MRIIVLALAIASAACSHEQAVNYAVSFVKAVSPDAQYVALGKDTVLLREGDALAVCFAAGDKHKTQCHTLADWGANPPRVPSGPQPVQVGPGPQPTADAPKAEPVKTEPTKQPVAPADVKTPDDAKEPAKPPAKAAKK